MNPFLLPADERLADWKQFRKLLAGMEDRAKLDAVAAYWSQAPLMALAYDLDDASKWPTPWQMIHSNAWCRNSIAIGMEATLRLAGIAADRLRLRLIQNRAEHLLLLVLLVDLTTVLNYDWGSVISHLQANYQIIHEWQFVDKTYSLLHHA